NSRPTSIPCAGRVGEPLDPADEPGAVPGGDVGGAGATRPDPDPGGAERAGGIEHRLALGSGPLVVIAVEAQVGAEGGDGEPGLLGELARPRGRRDVPGRHVGVAGPLDALEAGGRGMVDNGL